MLLVAATAAASLAFGGLGSASTPKVSSMTLQAADVPGAKIRAQGTVKEKGYVAAYQRTFQFVNAPYGKSQLIVLQVETMLAASAGTAARDLTDAEKAFRSKAGRAALIAEIAKDAGVKPKAVVIGKLRAVGGYDQGFEVPISVVTALGRVYENVSYLRIDRIAVALSETGLRQISAVDTSHFATIIADRISTALSPALVSPPTITGSAQQGQTLTATAGIWTADDATFTYQWQHCDPAGANCADIVGAAAQTYAVQPADVGTTVRVVVTASNRFDTPNAASAPTAVVS